MRRGGVAVLALAGCAPDQFSNYKASGFNGFVTRPRWTARRCRSGPMVITRNYEPPNYATAQYGVWLDQTRPVLQAHHPRGRTSRASTTCSPASAA